MVEHIEAGLVITFLLQFWRVLQYKKHWFRLAEPQTPMGGGRGGGAYSTSLDPLSAPPLTRNYPIEIL